MKLRFHFIFLTNICYVFRYFVYNRVFTYFLNLGITKNMVVFLLMLLYTGLKEIANQQIAITSKKGNAQNCKCEGGRLKYSTSVSGF